MKKVTNNNEYTHSVGYQNENGEKLNYVLQSGETIEVPQEHESLFKDIEGIVVENSNSSESKEVSETQKEETSKEGFTCPECGSEFTAKIAMLGHMRSHSKEEVKEETKE